MYMFFLLHSTNLSIPHLILRHLHHLFSFYVVDLDIVLIINVSQGALQQLRCSWVILSISIK